MSQGHHEEPSSYQKRDDVERNYRSAAATDLQKFRIVIGESDLWVLSNHNLKKEIKSLLVTYRRQLKEYIHCHPLFGKTFVPYPTDESACPIIQWMIDASRQAKVGPMAAVAGAIAGMIGKNFLDVPDLIIENGGDIYLRSSKDRIVSLYAGSSPFSGRVGLNFPPQPYGLGICTSAGTVGPSLSFGRADAVVVVSPDVALSDAVATAGANMVNNNSDLPLVIDFLKEIPNVSGALVIKDDKMAVWGEITLTPL